MIMLDSNDGPEGKESPTIVGAIVGAIWLVLMVWLLLGA